MTNPASGNTPPVASTTANAPASAAAPDSPPAAALHPASLSPAPAAAAAAAAAAPSPPPAVAASAAALASAPPSPLNLHAFATQAGSPAAAPDKPADAWEAGVSLSSPSPIAIWNAHLAGLEQWAQANRKDARNDTLAFWALKIPAILVSATAGIWAHYHWTTVTLIAGAVASVCVLIDGILPRGMLRNVHLRAFFDIRNLMNTMSAQYLSSSAQPANAIRKIIRRSERERQRIAVYIRDAETTLKSKPGP